MKIKALLIAFLLVPNVASAWKVWTQKEKGGDVFHIAEQAGDAGGFLQLVCFERKIHLEIVFPLYFPPEDDAVALLQVDNKPERLVAGFIEKIDRATSVFIGIDRRDEPAASTARLLREIAGGKYLYLGDPDVREAVEVWSLAGSRKAIKAIEKSCRA